MRLGFSALAIYCAALLQANAGGAQSEPHTFEMPRLNEVYTNVISDVLPIRQGPITVQLKFLEHSVELRNHRLEVSRDSEEQSYRFRIVVTVQGEADVESHLEIAGLPASLEDEIRLPLQSISISGRADVWRDTEGYHVSPQELPPYIQVEIESHLAQNMVTLCNGLAFLPGFGSACEGLEQSLAFIRIPLPEPGDTYLVPLSVLTDEEIGEFDEYLAAAI